MVDAAVFFFFFLLLFLCGVIRSGYFSLITFRTNDGASFYLRLDSPMMQIFLNSFSGLL